MGKLLSELIENLEDEVDYLQNEIEAYIQERDYENISLYGNALSHSRSKLMKSKQLENWNALAIYHRQIVIERMERNLVNLENTYKEKEDPKFTKYYTGSKKLLCYNLDHIQTTTEFLSISSILANSLRPSR